LRSAARSTKLSALETVPTMQTIKSRRDEGRPLAPLQLAPQPLISQQLALPTVPLGQLVERWEEALKMAGS